MAAGNIETTTSPRSGTAWRKRPSAPTADPVIAPARISLRGVSKTFAGRHGSVEALSSVSLSIGAGEFVSIIGPSGCGKSTLLMLVAGLEPATGGTIDIGGKLITKPTSDLGIVFQQDVLLEWRSALDNILLQCQIRGLDVAGARDRARELLAMVGIDGFASSYPHELSGGMRQRVSICRALVHDPPLLLMDEPFGALDALTRDQLQIDLLRLWSRRRMTVLFITHSISEAIFLSDRIVVMSPRPGRIEDVITVDLPRPRRLAVRETPEFIAYVRRVTEVFKSLGVLRDEDP
ncbi:MAG TPA: ABC transporter ATP-binding protein [Alphaproteobacteria bacterium]|nr:ABC transporter ATP-binding protein [Alphaproteobacteria bacterium]